MAESPLQLDYEQTLETFRQLADIRFKLLAFVPTLSGASIALLTKAAGIPAVEKVAIASVGFLVTLGVVLYDSRNTQFYNGAVGRARALEQELGVAAYGGDAAVGLFGSRSDHPQRYLLGVPVAHGIGLALVYAPVLGAWVLGALVAAGVAAWLALVAGSAVAALFFAQLLWHDGRPKALHDRLARRAATPPFVVIGTRSLVICDDAAPAICALAADGTRAFRLDGRRVQRTTVARGGVWEPALVARPKRSHDERALRTRLIAELAGDAASLEQESTEELARRATRARASSATR